MSIFKKNRSPLAQETELDTSGVLDAPYLVLTLLLVIIGLLMLFSASYARANWDTGNSAYYFKKQAVFAGIGILIMLAFSRLNYFFWYRTSVLVLGASLILLALVPVIGTTVNGAKRWITIAGIRFQPSELAKLGMIVCFGQLMSAWQDKMDTFSYGVVPYVLIMGAIAGLLALEHHLSATLIFLIIGGSMMLLGGTKKRWFLVGFLIAGVFLYFYVKKQDYAGDRLTYWLNPESDALDKGYQSIQSRLAIGSGGLLGLGFGRSRQKYLYLPEEHNDYIFAIVCEELGFVGAMGILLLFILLIIRGYWIAIHARDRFGALVAAGFTTKLAIQVFFNIGVVSGFLPPTGISLPFFSYGGTALLLQMLEMGIVLSISRWCVNKELVPSLASS